MLNLASIDSQVLVFMLMVMFFNLKYLIVALVEFDQLILKRIIILLYIHDYTQESYRIAKKRL